MPEPITESIVTPEWIAAVRTNYGLDTRTPFEAGAVWAAHGVVAGAVTALGHALDRIEELQRLPLATPELIADAARYQWLRDTLHGAKAGGGVEVNSARQVYEQPIPGEEVRIYWYQHTAVGFYEQHASTLDGAIDAARAAGGADA